MSTRRLKTLSTIRNSFADVDARVFRRRRMSGETARAAIVVLHEMVIAA